MATLALEQNIGRVRGRIRILRAVRWSARFALGGAGLALLLLIALKLARAPYPATEAALSLAACALAGAAFGYFGRLTLFQAAVSADTRLGLQERLSSALDLRRAPEGDPMVEALVDDATRRSEGIDVRAVYPLRAPREARYLAGALAVLALALFLPELPIFQSPQKRAEREAMKKEGERIVHIAKEMRKAADARDLDLQRRISQNLEQLGKEMRAARVSKKQALVKLNKMTTELAAAQKKLAMADAGKSLKQAAEELKAAARQAEASGAKGSAAKAANEQAKDGKSSESAAQAEAAKRLKEMADALAANDMDRAAKLLKEMANEAAGGKMSKEQAEALTKEAEKMAQAMSGTQLQEAAKQLQEAAKQLQQGQMAAAAQKFQQAGGT